MHRPPLTPEQDAEVSRKTRELVEQARLKDSIRQADLIRIKGILAKMIQEEKK